MHITTGTHVAQICWFLLTESRHFPGQLIQTSPPRRDPSQPGAYRIIDLDLSRYDGIARRHAQAKRDSISLLKAGIATRNAAFNRLIEQIEIVATPSAEPMLLRGPTGAGKSQLARRAVVASAAGRRGRRTRARAELSTTRAARLAKDTMGTQPTSREELRSRGEREESGS